MDETIREILMKLMEHKIEYEGLKREADYSINKSLIDNQKSRIFKLILKVEESVNQTLSEARINPPSTEDIDKNIPKEINLVWPYLLGNRSWRGSEQLKIFKLNYQHYQQKFSNDDLNLKALIDMYEEINRNLWIQSNEWKSERLKKYKSCQDSREKVKNDMLCLLDALTLVIANTKDAECAPSSYSLGISTIYDINHKYSNN
ncbi:MAG: hypothetical protein O9326_24660 [Microcystis sp. LE19-338.1B]|jgi:hypothetical protein|nr:hypothetical protein [Microcystis sp. LE19-338.1B]MCZ8357601.1 hypothetical protein [Microcystis sp. LE19-388.1G]